MDVVSMAGVQLSAEEIGKILVTFSSTSFLANVCQHLYSNCRSLSLHLSHDDCLEDNKGTVKVLYS